MGRTWTIVGCLLLPVLARAAADDRPTPPPADFRLHVASFGLGKEPVYTEEIVVHAGRAYVLPSNVKEVVIIEPARNQLVILDVGRRIQTEVTFEALEAALAKLKASLRSTIETLEKEGGRANEVEAKMTRELIEPRLATEPGSKPNRLRLTNPAVEVDADGEPEPDAARLATIAVVLPSIARLGAFRTPQDLPPFIELETIAALTGIRHQRPTELAYLYRLAGPPRKFHRTYQLIPTLTDREIEAIARVDRLRESAPVVRYERYRLAR